MKEKRIRIAALCCALAVLLSLAAAPLSGIASAADSGGACGEHLTWKLDSQGTLTISGAGPMTEHNKAGDYPWFSEKENIRSIVMEAGLTNIPEQAFYYCSNLTSVTIPNGVGSIGKSAFAGCEKLIQVTIPDSVTYMGGSTFWICRNLKEVTLSANLTSIPECAFQNCESLTSVQIPKNVTEIGDGAFEFCKKLMQVVILGDTLNIKLSAFRYCEQLQSITLPDTLNIIGRGAFEYCYKLREVFYRGSSEDWNNIDIGFDNELLTNAHINYDFPLNATLITLNKTESVLKIGGSETLTPTFYPEGTGAEPLRWSSSDSSLAEVTDGKILAKKPGNVTITAETLDGRISASCALTVTAPGADGVFRINSVSVLDNNGAELSAVPTGPFLARVSVTNETSSESPLIFFAAYSAEGKYQDFMYAFVDASPGATVRVTLPVDNSAGNIAELKAFAVSSFSDLSIIGNPVSFPAT